jgi:hypothetical protein
MDWGTIIGVIIGGSLSFGATYWLERRRDETARKRAQEELEADTRVGAMLVTTELRDAEMQFAQALRKDAVVPLVFSNVEWLKWAPTLARGLSHEQWGRVALAYTLFRDASLGAIFRGDDDAFTDEEKRTYAKCRDHLGYASAALADAQDLPSNEPPSEAR